MAPTSRYASFIVRLWRDCGGRWPEGMNGWQGEVEHIQTSRRWNFETLDELLALLQHQTEASATLE